MPQNLEKTKNLSVEVQECVATIYDEVNSLAEDFPIGDIHAAIKELDFFTSKTDECLKRTVIIPSRL